MHAEFVLSFSYFVFSVYIWRVWKTFLSGL